MASLALLAIGSLFWRYLPAKDQDPQRPSASQPSIAEPACGGQVPVGNRNDDRISPPDDLDPGINYSAIVRTACGDFEIDLWEDLAPVAVGNFVSLARQGFYDGLKFHHVVYDFIIQGGDPDNSLGGEDGPGYQLATERLEVSKEYGIVGFATAARRCSVGSQFVIVVHGLEKTLAGEPEAIRLPKICPFGAVSHRHFGSLDNIARQATAEDQSGARVPVAPIYIDSIEIIEKKGA